MLDLCKSPNHVTLKKVDQKSPAILYKTKRLTTQNPSKVQILTCGKESEWEIKFRFIKHQKILKLLNFNTKIKKF
jgi:hypothetical protein